MSGATSVRMAATVPTVDPKLLHVVRKLLNTHNDIALSNIDLGDGETRWYAAGVLVRQLQIKHREYQRKDIMQLKTAVDNVLEHISLHVDDPSQSTDNGNGSNHNTTSNTTSVSRQVQKRERALDQEETAYDQAAAARDALSNSNGVIGGGGLNACLRNRYKQVSLDRQHQLQALSSTSSGSVTVIDTELTPPHEPLHDHPTGDTNDHNSNIISKAKPEASKATQDTSVNSSSQQRKKIRRSNGRPRVPNLDSDALNGLDGTSSSSPSAWAPVPLRPTERYNDLGGLGDVIQTIRQLVEYPIARPELYRHLGVEPPRGVLLRGPPGTYVSRESYYGTLCCAIVVVGWRFVASGMCVRACPYLSVPNQACENLTQRKHSRQCIH
jgi:hypothetical protein